MIHEGSASDVIRHRANVPIVNAIIGEWISQAAPVTFISVGSSNLSESNGVLIIAMEDGGCACGDRHVI